MSHLKNKIFYNNSNNNNLDKIVKKIIIKLNINSISINNLLQVQRKVKKKHLNLKN